MTQTKRHIRPKISGPAKTFFGQKKWSGHGRIGRTADDGLESSRCANAIVSVFQCAGPFQISMKRTASELIYIFTFMYESCTSLPIFEKMVSRLHNEYVISTLGIYRTQTIILFYISDQIDNNQINDYKHDRLYTVPDQPETTLPAETTTPTEAIALDLASDKVGDVKSFPAPETHIKKRGFYLPPLDTIPQPPLEYRVPAYPCSKSLYLSLSPISSFPFRRNELASPDSPGSTSSGSVVSPRSASSYTPSTPSHFIDSRTSIYRDNVYTENTEPVNSTNDSLDVNHIESKDKEINEHDHYSSNIRSFNSDLTRRSSTVFPFSSFKPVLPIKHKLLSPIEDATVSSLQNESTSNLLTQSVHKPVPCLPLIHRPAQISHGPIANHHLSSVTCGTTEVLDLTNHTEKESRRCTLPPIPVTKQQVNRVFFLPKTNQYKYIILTYSSKQWIF